MQNGLDLEVDGINDFTYTLPHSSVKQFVGYYIYSRDTRKWSDLGSRLDLPTNIGHSISDDGKTTIVTLKDQLFGDGSTVAAKIVNVGFPLLNTNQTYWGQDNEDTVVTRYTTTKSTPLFATTKGVMALLFAAVAFTGLRRKEEQNV